ncbi:RNA polymerase II transcription factor B 52 kDa subunit [Friedmanniomyces endolithicus]|nr:RNA polymerase II transcription factor B 52 kDa subunit [Friedmanniomyces endolithicus]
MRAHQQQAQAQAQNSSANQSLANNAPVLPPTVVDQIRLWQLEGERMVSHRGYLIRDVGTAEEYDRAVRYAEALGVLRKEFRSRGSFFVTRMDQMSGYFKGQAARKREAAAAGKREGEVGGAAVAAVKREG